MSMPTKAAVDDATSEALASLALGDPELLGEGLALRQELQERSGLDPRTFALVKIAALIALDAPPASYLWQVGLAIDAGATHIDVALREGGQALIAVADNGGGMSPQELSLAVERHCTSKLPDDNLLEIVALGFRGEALPSIGAVSRLRMASLSCV